MKYNDKYLKMFMLMCWSVLGQVPSFSAEEPVLGGESDIKATLEKHTIAHPNTRTVLILGVIPGEHQFHERFDRLLSDPSVFVVFADKVTPFEPLPGHFLLADFNNDETLHAA